MSKHYFFLLLTIFFSNSAYAQCTITNTGLTGTCTITGGILTGNITISGNNVILPNFGITGLGTTNFTMANGSKLTLGDALTIADGATFNFSGTQGNIDILAGGMIYNKNGNGTSDGSFADLAAELTACSANPNCTSILAALPVELISWSARRSGEDVLLNWSSMAESYNDFYEIEHSLDGRTFTRLDKIAGSVESRELLNYSYLHRKTGGGTHFYRLSQQDIDGSRTVFGVLSVNMPSSGHATVYPNPVNAGASLQFELSDSSLRTAYLLDFTGKEVGQFSITPNGPNRLLVPANLVSGVYLLKYGEQSMRIVIR